MTAAGDAVVILIDCDNTLIDNDLVEADIGQRLEQLLGAAGRDRYWSILEQRRVESGYTDYLGALQQYRLGDLDELRLLEMSSFLLDFPFASRLYPRALDVLGHLRTVGLTVIVSDGDVVFQPWKIQRAGLWRAVDGRVSIYIHKEQMLEAIAARYPAEHYVMIDDKLRILTSVKRIWRERVTTIFPRQGHYALDRATRDTLPAADRTIDRIGDLLAFDRAALLGQR